MTREEILNMPAGREMDALIAENVMGIESVAFNDETKCPECESTMRFCGSRSWCSSCHEWIYSPYKEYSTDISAAWEVVEKLGIIFQETCIDNDKDWRCYFDNACASAETAPLAICRAALLAVMK